MMQWCRRRRSGWWLLMEKESRRRGFSTLSQQVLVEGNGYSRLALLNRPSSLNAINTSMVTYFPPNSIQFNSILFNSILFYSIISIQFQAARLHKLYRSWEDNHDIGFVMLKGTGRAFAAGGDIVSLYRFINQGTHFLLHYFLIHFF